MNLLRRWRPGPVPTPGQIARLTEVLDELRAHGHVLHHEVVTSSTAGPETMDVDVVLANHEVVHLIVDDTLGGTVVEAGSRWIPADILAGDLRTRSRSTGSGRGESFFCAPPEAVDWLRNTINDAAAQSAGAVGIRHFHERGNSAFGWGSRITVEAVPSAEVDLWYDAHDDEVLLLGDSSYREWQLWRDHDSWDDALVQRCLDEVRALVGGLAGPLAPELRAAAAKRLQSRRHPGWYRSLRRPQHRVGGLQQDLDGRFRCVCSCGFTSAARPSAQDAHRIVTAAHGY